MANVAWLRTIKRTVRPFVDISDLLNDCEIRCDKNGEFTAEESILLGDVDRSDLEIAIRVPPLPEDIAERAKTGKGSLKVIIVANDARLKKSECLCSIPIDDLKEDSYEYEIPLEQLNLFAWYGRVKLEVILVLSEDQPLSPGSPFLAGQWLARKVFSLGALSENPTFPVFAAKSEEFKKRGLPEDTVYYVDFNGCNLNIPYEEIANTFKVFVHEDVFNILLRRESTNAAKLAQSMLSSEIIACVLSAALKEFDPTDTMLENGVLKWFTDKIQDSTGADLKTQKAYAAESGYPRLKTIVQSYLTLKKAFLAI